MKSPLTARRSLAGGAALCGILLLGSDCRPDRGGAGLLLLITVDTLRADHVGAYGGPDLTPSLDRLAAESEVFSSAYSTAASTCPSLASLMTSRYPEEVGIDGNSAVLDPTAPSLAAWLRARGWQTGAVVSNFVLRRESGFDHGFEHYDDTLPDHESVRLAPERRAPATVDAALRLLDALGRTRRPVFLWVHYQDPHGPYSPPEALREQYLAAEREAADGQVVLPVATSESGVGAIPMYQFLQERTDPAFYRAGYKGEVALADEWIGRLLDGLRDRGLMKGATIIFAADHGEGMGEEDYWFAHGERLTEPLVHVPLFIRAPGRPGARRNDVVSLLDVFPTLAALVGSSPPEGVRGRDLLLPSSGTSSADIYLWTPRANRRGIIAEGFKYLVAAGEQPPEERLFRLGEEGLDLAIRQPELLRAMRDRLGAARASLRTAPVANQQLDAGDREKLKALGYVEE